MADDDTAAGSGSVVGDGVRPYTSAELQAMQAQLQGKAWDSITEDAPKPTPTPSVAAPPVEAPSPPPPPPDPFPTPEGLFPIRDVHYLWTIEAIEASKYKYDGATRYRPLDGILIGRHEDTLHFIVFSPLIVADGIGRLVEVKDGVRVVVHLNHSLRRLLPLVELDGCAHPFIRPLGYHTLISSQKDMIFEIGIEPDINNRNMPRMISLESVMGRVEALARRSRTTGR